MQVNPGEPPKVAGLAWEANLYASLLGAMAPFALEYFRARRRVLSAVPAVLIIVAMGLGVTRGAYLGLAAGLGVYLLVLVTRSSARSSLARVVALIAVAAVLAPVSATLLLPAERPGVLTALYTSLVNPAHATPSAGPSPTPSAGPSPTPSPSPSAGPAPPVDTLEFRLNRVPAALSDLGQSPIIGLGAATYGQRHAMPYEPGMPDYLAILALVTVYESGILGAVALGGGLLLVLWMLFRASKHSPGLAAAYAGSLVSLLVAYEATNALFFSFNWLIIGAALAFAVRTLHADTNQSGPTV
jgi:O-antigen ligase